MIKLSKSLLTLSFAALLTACGSHPIYTVGAKVMEDFGESVATPHVLELTDVDVTCRFGSNMSPLFGTFNSLTDTGLETLSLLYLLSANCSEQSALAAELRSIRALQNGLVNEAKDARTEQKRWLKLTAERRKRTFESAMAAYNYDYTDSEAKCPKLKQPQDQLVFLLGLLTGLQAILADSGAELAAGVPRNIAPAAVRASYCLDDDAWGGSPSSIRAAIWTLLPDLKSNKDLDTWQLLNASSEKSLAFGIRIPIALQAIMAETTGNEAELNRALAMVESSFQAKPEYALVDAIAISHVQSVSDRQWTTKHGERTPFGRLGKPATPQVEDDAADLDALF